MRSLFPPKRSRIPRYGAAVLRALQLSAPDPQGLKSLDEAAWRKALVFCDSARLTLTLGHFCRASLPGCVETRIEKNHRDNAERFARLKAALLEITDSLASRNIEFVLLKGFAHSPEFTPDPLLRAQTDLDLWCKRESVFAARDAMLGLGYKPLGDPQGRHLPPMVRERNWQWRNDYFAKDLPMPVELHHKLWDEDMERIPAPPEQDFWARRMSMSMEGRTVCVLVRHDALAFAALHLLMHVLHGDLQLQRAWEIAHFLHTRVSDHAFWQEWHQLHPAELRKLEVVAFALTARWFGCALPPLVEREMNALPGDIKLWMLHFAWSPVEALFAPNKDELWLNLSLLSSYSDQARVFFRRLLPVPFPKASTSRECSKSLDIIASRAIRHTRTFFPTLMTGLKWWWMRSAAHDRLLSSACK